ncbi:GNAT family N-acetyltransferase [Clostridium sp. ATCC 25772]|uniref:GNAT family N-acetyltransferase n=1 Tax=Clostridium sp. ATCC 25772 TaxID=1676991 RepID=UPI000783A7A7|nr:GNAT family N-acetyltransferase [Clostridium sp. ATCC 25772]
MIRKMKKEDLLYVKQLMQSIPDFWHPNWNNKTLEKAFNSSNAIVFVYEIENKIVGCIFAYDFGFRAYIAKLAVSKEMQKHRIGSKLLEHVENILMERNCELIMTDALPSSESFYLKLGWTHPYAKLVRKRLIK